jgi:hypothetical protein
MRANWIDPERPNMVEWWHSAHNVFVALDHPATTSDKDPDE